MVYLHNDRHTLEVFRWHRLLIISPGLEGKVHKVLILDVSLWASLRFVILHLLQVTRVEMHLQLVGLSPRWLNLVKGVGWHWELWEGRKSWCSEFLSLECLLLFDFRDTHKANRRVMLLHGLIDLLGKVINFTILVTVRKQYCLLAKARPLIGYMSLRFAVDNKYLVLGVKTPLERFLVIIYLLGLLLILLSLVLSVLVSSKVCEIEGCSWYIPLVALVSGLLEGLNPTLYQALMSLFLFLHWVPIFVVSHFFHYWGTLTRARSLGAPSYAN